MEASTLVSGGHDRGSAQPRARRRPVLRRYSIGAVPRLVAPVAPVRFRVAARGASRLAQLVERKTLNLVVVGSSPTVGAFFFFNGRWLCSSPITQETVETRTDLLCMTNQSHTWPDHSSDQIGLMVIVEQGHCTLVAVKRYWDTMCWRTA